MSLTPRQLARRLAALEVTVEAGIALALGVLTPDYPGGVRPSAEVHLSGRGWLATGEHVAFDFGAQERFAADAMGMLRGRRGAVGDLLDAATGEAGSAWRRTALEGALIDLALRQAGLSLFEIAGLRSAAMRYVVSFEAAADPSARIAALSRRHPRARFKVDVDPTWSDAALESLAATAAVEILDFKGRGDATRAARIADRFPAVLVEDPPAGAALPPARVARDQPLTTLAAVSAAAAAGHAINVKAPRLGGFLAALEAIELARAAGAATVYLGGMSEVGVGRRQSRALAALFTAEAPNDLAPIAAVEPEAAAASLAIRLDAPGFGS